nr:hypothetical protein [Desulfobacula sp.]
MGSDSYSIIQKNFPNGDTAHSNLGVSVFSDCIVVTGQFDNYHGVVWAVGWLQAQLLGAGILTRGGISIGKVFHSDEVLYGIGMLNAYRIESSAAVYPRIVIDPKLAIRLPENYKSIFLSLDADGLFFVDPFAFNETSGSADVLFEDGWDPHEVYLEEVERHIKNGISSAKRVDHQSKWTWLSLRHAIAKAEYKKIGETRLTLLMKQMPNQANSAIAKK